MLDDEQAPADLHNEKEVEIPIEELLETETVDIVELLADEPSDDELVGEDELEIAQLMDPYELNDY